MSRNNEDLANRPVLTSEEQEDLSQKLIIAVKANKIEEVNSLIEAGADVDKADKNDLTAFFIAIELARRQYNPNPDVLKAMIKGILDGDNVRNLQFLFEQLEKNRNIIIYNSSKSDVEKLAVSDSEEIQNLIDDHTKIVKLLIQKGVDVNKVDKDGGTALFYAVYNDYKETIQLLLKKGANVNYANNNGKTPFSEAIRRIILATEGNVSTNIKLDIKTKRTDTFKAVIKGILDGDNVGNLEFLSKQLEGEQIRNIIIDNSSKSDVEKLAVFASEEIQDLIINHFNERNPGNHIDTGEGSEVAILRELKSDYLTPSAENVSSSEKKVSIPRLGNIAFNQILKSPELYVTQIKDSKKIFTEEKNNVQPNCAMHTTESVIQSNEVHPTTISNSQPDTSPHTAQTTLAQPKQSPKTQQGSTINVGRGGNVGCSIS